MHQQGRRAIEAQYGGISDELDLSSAGKSLEHEEIAIAVHQPDRHTMHSQLFQRARDVGIERIAQVIIAGPVLEQITEDIERIGCSHTPLEELEEHRVDMRALR